MTQLSRLSSKLFTILGKAAAAGPSYSITPSTTSIAEGSTVTLTVSISGAADGTYYFMINPLSGTITVDDFATVLPANLSGAVAVSGGSGSISLEIQSDDLTETETFNVSLMNSWTANASTILANTTTITISDATPPNGWDLGTQTGGAMGTGETLYNDFGTNTWPYLEMNQDSGVSSIYGLNINQHGTYQSTPPYSGNALIGNGNGGSVIFITDFTNVRLARFNIPFKDFRRWNRQIGWDFQNENYVRLTGTGGYHISPNPAVVNPHSLHFKPGGRWYYLVDRSPAPHSLRLWHGETGLEGPGGVNDTFYTNVGGGISHTDWVRYYSWNPTNTTYGGIALSGDGGNVFIATTNELFKLKCNPAGYVSNTSLSFEGAYYWPYAQLNQTNRAYGTSHRAMAWKDDGTAFIAHDTATFRFYSLKPQSAWNLDRIVSDRDLGTTATQYYTHPSSRSAFSIYIDRSAASPSELFFTTGNNTTYTAPGTSDAISRPSVEKFNISGWSIDGMSFNQIWHPNNFWHERLSTISGLTMNTARTKLMFLNDTGFDGIYSYTLSSAGNLSTAVWDGANSYPRMNTQTGVGGYSPTTTYSVQWNSDGTKLYILGTTMIVQFNCSVAYELGSAEYGGRFTINGQDSAMRALYIRDASNFYTVGLTNDRVYYYTMSSGNISSASYSGTSFLVSGQEINPTGLFFRDDGTRMYIIGTTNRTFRQYQLSTAWNISTATYTSGASTRSVAAQTTTPLNFFIGNSGTRVYVAAQTAILYQYALGTAWDFAGTLTYQGSRTVSNETVCRGIFFKPDGTTFYTQGGTYCYMHSCNAWDMLNGYSMRDLNRGNGYFNLIGPTGYAPLGASTTGGIFTDDGLNFLIGYSNDLAGFTCTAAWNLSTMSYYWNHARSTSIATTYTTGVFRDMMRPTGNTSLLLTMRTGYVEKWTTTAALPQPGIGGWLSQENITTGFREHYNRWGYWAGASTDMNGCRHLGIYNDDRTLIMHSAIGPSAIYRWDLAANSVLAGATFASQGTVSTSTTGPTGTRGMAFNREGNVLYLGDLSTTTPVLYRNRLSTPFNASTTSFPVGAANRGENFVNKGYYYFGSANGSLGKVRWRTDGTSFYVNNSSTIFQYNCGTAWDISTATYFGSYAPTPQTFMSATNLADFFFDTSGTYLTCLSYTQRYLVGGYTLGTAWNITTASRTGTTNEFSLSSQITTGNTNWFWFGRGGRSVIVRGATSASTYKYELSVAWDMTTCSYVNSFGAATSGYSGASRTVPQTGLVFQEYDDNFGPYLGIGYDTLTNDGSYYFPFGTTIQSGTAPGKISRWWAQSTGHYPGGFWDQDQRYSTIDRQITKIGSLQERFSGIAVEQSGTRIYLLDGTRYKMYSYRTYNPGGGWTTSAA